MNALLICPDERMSVAALAEPLPFSNIPILGKSLLDYWLTHLATLGAEEVLVLAVDRADQVRAEVGDGARWGLRVKVQSERREMTVEEARAKYQTRPATWLPAPNDSILVDHLPGLPRLPLLTSYADWFFAVRTLMSKPLTPDRIGVHELKPGVLVGLHAHVPLDAKLIAPCWIGEWAWIEADATIGPNAMLEKEVFIGRGVEISHSHIGPQTFVGQFTEIRNSIAWGDTLVNWERDSCLKVSDEFLLCSLHPHRTAAPAKTPSILRVRDYVSQVLTSLFAESDPPR